MLSHCVQLLTFIHPHNTAAIGVLKVPQKPSFIHTSWLSTLLFHFILFFLLSRMPFPDSVTTYHNHKVSGLYSLTSHLSLSNPSSMRRYGLVLALCAGCVAWQQPC